MAASSTASLLLPSSSSSFLLSSVSGALRQRLAGPSGSVALYLYDAYAYACQAQVSNVRVEELKTGDTVCWVSLTQTVMHPQGGGQPSDRGAIDGHPVDLVRKRFASSSDSQPQSSCSMAVNKEVDSFDVEHGFYLPPKRRMIAWHVHQPVLVEIDRPHRVLNAAYHSAGHLIAHLVERAFSGQLVATGGHHHPGEARVVFTISSTAPADVSKSAVEAALEAALADIKQREGPISVQWLPQHISSPQSQRTSQASTPLSPTAPQAKLEETATTAAGSMSESDSSSSPSTAIVPDNAVSPACLPPLVRHILFTSLASSVPCGGTHLSSVQELGEVQVRSVKMNVKKQEVVVGYEVKNIQPRPVPGFASVMS